MGLKELYKAIKAIYYKLAAIATVSAFKGTNVLDQLSPANIDKLKKAVRLIFSVARESHILDHKEMKKFKKVLNELNFRSAKDSDYPGGDKQLIVFQPDAEYKRMGKTHGAASHAIKHYAEFHPLVVKKLLEIVEKWVQDAETKYLINSGGRTIASGDEINSKISNDILLNTFDYINDKKEMGRTLLEIERRIYVAIEKIKQEYSNEIQSKIKKAVSIDTDTFAEIKKKIRAKKIIKFKADYFGDIRTYIFDPSTTGLISIKGNTVQTYFQVDKSGTGITSRVKYYLTNKMEPMNDHFKTFLEIV